MFNPDTRMLTLHEWLSIIWDTSLIGILAFGIYLILG